MVHLEQLYEKHRDALVALEVNKRHIKVQYDKSVHPRKFSEGDLVLVAAFHTPGSRGRNLQATRCVIGGKSQVKAITLFLTPPFRPTPNGAKGGRPY